MAEGGRRPGYLSRTNLAGSEFYFDFYCQPCQEEDRHFEAVGYCKDCGEYLCEECYRSHRRAKPSRHHVLLDGKHMPKDSTSSCRDVYADRQTYSSNTHPDSVTKTYCHIHDILACSTCSFTDRRKHNEDDLKADDDDSIWKSKASGETLNQSNDLANQAFNLEYSDGDIDESSRSTHTIRNLHQKKNTAVNETHINIKVQPISDIKVRSKSDTSSCRITGVTILPDSKLVAVDQNNSKVKVIDVNKHKVVYELMLESDPWDVTSMNKYDIAVTLPGVRQIQYLHVSVDGTVCTIKNLNVNGKCHGIAFARDKLWVTYISPGKLEALTLDGDVIICINTYESGHDIFSMPQYVDVSSDMETVYVSDYNKNALFCITSTGKLLSTCKFGLCKYGVAVIVGGTICMSAGGKVCLLTSECKLIKILLDVYETGGSALGMTYDADTRWLFVGTHRLNVIKVFFLKRV